MLSKYFDNVLNDEILYFCGGWWGAVECLHSCTLSTSKEILHNPPLSIFIFRKYMNRQKKFKCAQKRNKSCSFPRKFSEQRAMKFST